MSRRLPQDEQAAACRPGRDDASTPEFGELRRALEDPAFRARFERAQRFDAAVAQAIRQVDVPSGLEARILASLPVPASADVTPARHDAAPSRVSRRAWLSIAGLSGVAATVAAVSAWRWNAAPSRPGEITKGQLANRVDGWLAALSGEAPWRQDVDAARIGDTAVLVDEDVVARPSRWRELTDAKSPAVVFDLAQADGPAAWLFVMPTHDVYDLPGFPSPPMFRLSTSGDLATTAWQRNGFVTVLAAEEDGRSLDTWVREPRIA